MGIDEEGDEQAADDALDEASLVRDGKTEDEMEETLEDFEEHLLEVEEEKQAALERDLDKVLNGDNSSTLLADEDVGEDDKEEEGESTTFQGWLKRCVEEQRHFYLTNIHTGECACPDRSMVAYICKHLMRGLHMSGNTMMDLPWSVVNAAHLCNDVEACKGVRMGVRRDTMVVNPSKGSSPDTEACEYPLQDDGPPPSPPSSPSPVAASPSTSPSTAGEPTPDSNLQSMPTRRMMQNQCEQGLKVLTSYAHAEMPDEVYSSFTEKVEELLQTAREIFQEASVPGEFGVMGKGKGSQSRKTHSITHNKTLRGTKGNEYDTCRTKGRPGLNKPKLPDWQTINSLENLDIL